MRLLILCFLLSLCFSCQYHKNQYDVNQYPPRNFEDVSYRIIGYSYKQYLGYERASYILYYSEKDLSRKEKVEQLLSTIHCILSEDSERKQVHIDFAGFEIQHSNYNSSAVGFSPNTFHSIGVSFPKAEDCIYIDRFKCHPYSFSGKRQVSIDLAKKIKMPNCWRVKDGECPEAIQ